MINTRPVELRSRWHLLIAALLTVLGIGATSYGFRSRLALAEPESASPPYATTPMPQQSVQARPVSADADVGPGQCEPCVVGLQ